jgi:diacylglycerol kinase
MMRAFFKGFLFAFNGLCFLVKKERNFKVHLVLFSFVIIAGFFFKITSIEWIAILLTSALVLSLEAVNTAIEQLSNLYSKEENPTIKTIKDVAAGAVLLAALFAAAIGILIFYPYVSSILFSS